MSLIAVIGAFLQLTLLILSKWFEWGNEKKKEREALYEQGKKAIANRDVCELNAVINRIGRM
jgi:hypothetical protein